MLRVEILKITSIDSAEKSGVSHNPKITKHVLIANGEIANITNFSEAVFPLGETAYAHCHSDMTEIFFIKSGSGTITVNGRVILLDEGMCVTVAPNEVHEIINSGVTELVVMCIGIKT